MTRPKRWPDHAEWARLDGISRQQTIKNQCEKLLRTPLSGPVKMIVMEMKMAAQETELALLRAKDPD